MAAVEEPGKDEAVSSACVSDFHRFLSPSCRANSTHLDDLQNSRHLDIISPKASDTGAMLHEVL